MVTHPFDEVTYRHRILHYIEQWAIIVGWCTMWIGLIFYLGNEFGRIDRDVMTMATIGIIALNCVFVAIELMLFSREICLERMEARAERARERMLDEFAASIHLQRSESRKSMVSPHSHLESKQQRGHGTGPVREVIEQVNAQASFASFQNIDQSTRKGKKLQR